MRQRHRQEGAALVLAIAICSVAVLAWQQRASLSQLFMAQQVLEQSTLAASLAASQHHARLLNAHAFLNRTVMAHQVAMAHLMTVASAEKMRVEMSRQVMRGNPPLYLIAMMFGPKHAAAYAASKVSAAGQTMEGLRQLHLAFQAHDRSISEDLDRARGSLLKNIHAQTHEIVKAVLDKNMAHQPHHSVNVIYEVDLPLKELQPTLIDPHGAIWRDWFKETIAQHPYLKKRNDTARNWWMVSKGCPHMRHQLRRRGESMFKFNYWQVTDSLSFHAVRGFRVKFCYWREYPMGFANIKNLMRGKKAVGPIDAVFGRPNSGPEDFRKITFFNWVTSQYSWTAWMHGFRNVLADGRGYSSQLVWHPRARVRPYILSRPDRLVTRLRVRQAIGTLDDPILRLGLRLKGLLRIGGNWGQYLHAQSAAQAYFDAYQPSAADAQVSANLFQPFWMAKNVLP